MSEMKLGRIGQIAITVNDVERSVAFYRDVVGLSFMFQAPNVAFFDCAGVRFMLGQSPQPDAKPSGTYLYFDSEDIERDYATIESRGATVMERPHIVAPLGDKHLWLGAFADPDGNVFELMQLR